MPYKKKPKRLPSIKHTKSTGFGTFRLFLSIFCVLLFTVLAALMVGASRNMDMSSPVSGIVDPLTPYTSKKLYADLQLIAEMNPDIVSLSSIGQSALGKEIPLLKLGKGQRPVLWIAALHSREVATSAYLMLTAEQYAEAYTNGTSLGHTSAEKVQWLLDEFTVYLVPMANPDGVDIVTADGPANISVDNASSWKSNANGVNLNRNFPFDWDGNREKAGYNHEYYRGPYEASEPETAALMGLCESVAFEHMVSCHVQGKLIYWRDDKNGIIPGDEALANEIAQIMDFSIPRSTSRGLDGWSGGFENWFRYRFNKPGLCLEFARNNKADADTMARFYNDDMMDWPKSQNLIFDVLDSMSTLTADTTADLTADLTAEPTSTTVHIGGEPDE